MDATPSIATIGAMVGSPARASMLTVLFDGRALTATELGQVAGVAPATASEHLNKLVASGLLVCERHGRHRYFRITGARVAEALEPMFHLVEPLPPTVRKTKPVAMREARLCYDHLAGNLGVKIATALVDCNVLIPNGRDYDLTTGGEDLFRGLGVDLTALRRKRRMFARQCLDWSERKPHLAGSLGAALADTAFGQGWIKRTNRRRIVRVTDEGRTQFSRLLNVET